MGEEDAIWIQVDNGDTVAVETTGGGIEFPGGEDQIIHGINKELM